jgi:antitoxin ParD1/3/4
MSKNKTSIALSDHFAEFIDAQVATGRFASASEVVRAGLRLLQEQEAKLKKLRELIHEGDESGESKPLNRAALHAEMKASRRSKSKNA